MSTFKRKSDVLAEKKKFASFKFILKKKNMKTAATKAITKTGRFNDFRYVPISTTVTTFNEDRFFPRDQPRAGRSGLLAQEEPVLLTHRPSRFHEYASSIVLTPLGVGKDEGLGPFHLSRNSSSSNYSDTNEVWWFSCEDLPADYAFPIRCSELQDIPGLVWEPFTEQVEATYTPQLSTSLALSTAIQETIPSGPGDFGAGSILKAFLRNHLKHQLPVQDGMTTLLHYSSRNFAPVTQALVNPSLGRSGPAVRNDFYSPGSARHYTTGMSRSRDRTRAGRKQGELSSSRHREQEAMKLHSDELQLDFPFYAGLGDTGGQKLYLDTTAQNLAKFGTSKDAELLRHGKKILYPGGLAVCIGVAPNQESEGAPLPYWYPLSGVPGCCIIPHLHGTPLMDKLKLYVSSKESGGGEEQEAEKDGSKERHLPDRTVPGVVVGEILPTPNGPADDLSTTSCSEDPSRYLFTSVKQIAKLPPSPSVAGRNRQEKVLDESNWLNAGLFGATVGEPLPGRPEWTVTGVGVTEKETLSDDNQNYSTQLSLFAQKRNSDEVCPVEDAILFS